MMPRLAVALLVCLPALASASPQLTRGLAPDLGAKSRVAFTFGLLTPTGEGGVEYTQSVIPNLEIGVGLGMGVWGPQASVMPRLRAGAGDTSVTLGAGLSGGPHWEKSGGGLCFTTNYEQCRTSTTDTTVLWANVELGYQNTWPSGGMVRVYGGAGRLLAHATCTGPRCDNIDGTTLPFVGVAFGHTL